MVHEARSLSVAWLISSPLLPNLVELKSGGVKNAPEVRNECADADYWIKDEENDCVIRIHRTPRKKLFDPRALTAQLTLTSSPMRLSLP